MGCIPIVERHPGFLFLLENTKLPVLVVDDFYRVTVGRLKEFLRQQASILPTLWDVPHKNLSYWKEKITAL